MACCGIGWSHQQGAVVRDYAKVAPQFWTGQTGKALKGAGPEAVIVAMYLMTSPHANMIGVYHCPLAYIAFDTGLGIEGASKGLASAIAADFCTFEAESDYVFVHAFAAYQIGDELDPKDNRCKAVVSELSKVPKGSCWRGFRARYAVPFHLPLPSPLEAPSKPGAGAGAGEGTEAGTGAIAPSALSGKAPRKAREAKPAPPSAEVWEAYASAYQGRYHVQPVRNASVNAHLAQFVGRVGADEAPAVAAHFVQSQNGLYVAAMHPTNLLLRDAEKLRTEWATGRMVTRTQAQQADRTQTNANAFAGLLARAEQEAADAKH